MTRGEMEPVVNVASSSPIRVEQRPSLCNAGKVGCPETRQLVTARCKGCVSGRGEVRQNPACRGVAEMKGHKPD